MSNKIRPSVNVTVAQLVEVLREINFPTMVGMTTLTDVEMTKYDKYWNTDAATGKKTKNPNAVANPYYGQVKCLAKKFRIITGFDYVNAVGTRRENEGLEREFKQGEAWFEQISKGLVQHKNGADKFYFRYQYLEDSTISSEYFFNNEPIEKEKFDAYRTAPSDYANQGLEKTLNFQVVALENIKEITLNGIHYIVVV
jgi:hypothetical protein